MADPDLESDTKLELAARLFDQMRVLNSDVALAVLYRRISVGDTFDGLHMPFCAESNTSECVSGSEALDVECSLAERNNHRVCDSVLTGEAESLANGNSTCLELSLCHEEVEAGQVAMDVDGTDHQSLEPSNSWRSLLDMAAEPTLEWGIKKLPNAAASLDKLKTNQVKESVLNSVKLLDGMPTNLLSSNFSVVMSAKRIADVILNAATVLEDDSKEVAGTTTKSSADLNSLELVSRIEKLAAIEAQLRLAIAEDDRLRVEENRFAALEKNNERSYAEVVETGALLQEVLGESPNQKNGIEQSQAEETAFANKGLVVNGQMAANTGITANDSFDSEATIPATLRRLTSEMDISSSSDVEQQTRLHLAEAELLLKHFDVFFEMQDLKKKLGASADCFSDSSSDGMTSKDLLCFCTKLKGITDSTRIMDFVFDEISNLYSLELYDDVILLLEVCASELAFLSRPKAAVVAAMGAESYFQCGQYTQSEEAFYRAIRILKSNPPALCDPNFCEAELKFRLHRCLVRQNKREDALKVLESVPEHDQSPKIKAGLAQLHSMLDIREQRSNSTQASSSALIYHKQVLENCPTALRSLSFVLRAGVRKENNEQWTQSVSAWINAQEAVSEKDYPKAISALCAVAENNLRIIIEIGKLYYLHGERQKAANYLQRAHCLDLSFPSCMDLLAYIFTQEQKSKELESLSNDLMRSAESPEAWIAYGFLAKSQAKHDSALFFAQKACLLSDSQIHPMAMLLKALVLMEKKKYDEAVKQLREALVYDPSNYDLYETLVQAYIEQRRPNDARLTASHCRHHLGQENARALYLCAKVAAKSDVAFTEAQSQLEKAVSLSPHLLDAVILLVELYDRAKCYDKAIALLKKQTQIHVDTRLHRLLGDFLARTNQLEAACDRYNLVGSFDPDTASSAMNSLEGMVGLSTPEAPLPPMACPAAPRRRGGPHSDALSATTERNS